MGTVLKQASHVFAPHPSGAKITFLVAPGVLLLFLVNFRGLVPYVYPISASIFFTLSLSFICYLTSLLCSLNPSKTPFIRHLVPLGAPRALAPFMVLVESVSHVIRPITLSVRLIANLVAGHLLIRLVVGPVTLLSKATLVCLSAQFILVCLEVAVALVQSYVFFNLISLYKDSYRALLSRKSGNFLRISPGPKLFINSSYSPH